MGVSSSPSIRIRYGKRPCLPASLHANHSLTSLQIAKVSVGHDHLVCLILLASFCKCMVFVSRHNEICTRSLGSVIYLLSGVAADLKLNAPFLFREANRSLVVALSPTRII